MTRLPLHRFTLPFLLVSLASAAGTISGPVAGYTTDPSRAQLRTIFGVPGALRFSDPLPLPEGVTQIRLAPGQDFALVERANSTPAILHLKDGAIDRVSPIDAALSKADWIAFSPSAGSAMLYSAGANRLQVVSGLPDAPQVSLDIDASGLPEQPAMGALSEDGSLVLVASAGALYRIPGQGPAQLILSPGGIRSIAVLRNGSDAVVSDPTTGSVHVVRNIASHSESRVLASGLDGIDSVFPSSDGRLLYVARPGASAVSSVDLSTGEVQSYASSASPDGLMPLRNRDTFLISAQPHEPGWIFYQDGATARTVFVPAVRVVTRELPGKGDKR